MGRVSTCQKNCNTIDLRRAQVNDWTAGAANSPSQLTKDCQPSECTEEHYVSLPGMEHMSVELRKYMVIHIYGITLNTAKSADQYYSSYSYQSLSLIIYLTYNDLHHDCKPYEQTREFFTVSLYSP